jgi:hypothetical protein
LFCQKKSCSLIWKQERSICDHSYTLRPKIFAPFDFYRAHLTIRLIQKICANVKIIMIYLLGNSGKLVTLETLSLTKFLRHVFQGQETHDFQKPGTCEASDSRMRKIRGSWFGEEVESRTCGSPESRAGNGANFGRWLIRESVGDSVRESRAGTCTNL